MKSVFLIIFALCFTASASTVVLFDTTAAGGNSWPLDQSYGAGQYQQSYGGSAFGGLVKVTGVTFFMSYPYYSGNWNTQIGVSSIDAGQALSTDYAQNLGSDYAVVFSGTSAPANGVAHFDFATPFEFQGGGPDSNLLIDITMLQNNCFACDAQAGYGDMSRVFKLGGYYNTYFGSMAEYGYGLKTQFDVQPVQAGVPEPGTTALLIAGGALFIAIGRRRKSPVLN